MRSVRCAALVVLATLSTLALEGGCAVTAAAGAQADKTESLIQSMLEADSVYAVEAPSNFKNRLEMDKCRRAIGGNRRLVLAIYSYMVWLEGFKSDGQSQDQVLHEGCDCTEVINIYTHSLELGLSDIMVFTYHALCNLPHAKEKISAMFDDFKGLINKGKASVASVSNLLRIGHDLVGYVNMPATASGGAWSAGYALQEAARDEDCELAVEAMSFAVRMGWTATVYRQVVPVDARYSDTEKGVQMAVMECVFENQPFRDFFSPDPDKYAPIARNLLTLLSRQEDIREDKTRMKEFLKSFLEKTKDTNGWPLETVLDALRFYCRNGKNTSEVIRKLDSTDKDTLKTEINNYLQSNKGSAQCP